MEKSSALTKLVFLVIISILVNSSLSHGSMTCEEIRGNLLPCIPYITVGDTKVPNGCCNGLKTVVNQATTTPDRQNLCSCFKASASAANDDQLKRAAAIPKICAVPISFDISRDVDCSKVK